MPPAEVPGAGAGPVLVLDSGGGYIRAGPAAAAGPVVVEPNCTALAKGGAQAGRPVAIGAEVLQLPAYSLHRPTRRGLLLDPEQQRSIWDRVLRHRLPPFDARECPVLVTEAPLTPMSIKRETEEIMFETFGFKEVSILPGPPLSLYSPGLRGRLDPMNPCTTVLSMGHSSCVAVPCLDKQVITHAIRRLNVGGRVLTNILLERLGLQHYDLSENWMVAEDILSKLCEVSPDFDLDQRTRFKRIEPKRYVLPDFNNYWRGFVETRSQAELANDELQRVTLAAERVAVPEALFSPRDHGVNQAGLAELVHQAILAVREPAWRPHLGQVVLCGGLARLPNLRERLQRELRRVLPSAWPVSVVRDDEPELSTWRGAAQLALHPEFRRRGFKSRKTWEEEGSRAGEGANSGVKRKAS